MKAKVPVAIGKSVWQLSCVSQETEPPESAAISRKGTKECRDQTDEYDSQGVHCVKQTFEERKVRRSGKFKSKFLISEATLWCLRTDLQEGLQDRSDAPAEMRGNLPGKSVSSKKEDKATFYSPSDEWIFPAASTIKPEERKFVVDSGASIHMVSKIDLNSAELDTLKISKNPTVVMTANGEVQAKKEATVYVRGLDLFVTVMLLEETPAVLSPGKLCEEFGYSYHWTSGQKPHLVKKGKKIHCDTSKNVPFVVPVLYTSSSSSSTSTSSSQETGNETEIPATRRSESASEDTSARGNSWHESTEIENPSKNDDEELQDDESQGVPDWLAGVQGRIDWWTCSRTSRVFQFFSWITFGAASTKWYRVNMNIFTHFPKDRNLDICLRTKITRASCRRRTGAVVPGAEHFGDLMTADHKVLGEGCESWLLSGYNLTHVKRKLLRKHKRARKSSWSRPGNPKVISHDNSLVFGKACEESTWIQ